jgi:hypothetical protein
MLPEFSGSKALDAGDMESDNIIDGVHIYTAKYISMDIRHIYYQLCLRAHIRLYKQVIV